MKYRNGYAFDFVNNINKSDGRFLMNKDSRPINTIKEMLETSVALFHDNVAFMQKFKGDKEFTEIKYSKVLEDVNALGTSLINRGLKGKSIAVIGENSYWWALCYLATVCGVGVVVPVDKELDGKDVLRILENADVSCVFYGSKYGKIFDGISADALGKSFDGTSSDDFRKGFDGVSADSSGKGFDGTSSDASGKMADNRLLCDESDFFNSLIRVEMPAESSTKRMMPGNARPDEERKPSGCDGGQPLDGTDIVDEGKALIESDGGQPLGITDLIEEGKALIAAGDRSFIDAEIETDEMSVLLFTSGTTGASKGVMLSQKNLCTDLMSAPNALTVTPEDLFFSVLPIHHTYECTCGFLMPLYKGATIGFCQGLKYIQKNLKELRPTFFLGVPLIFEKLYNAIWKNIRKQNKESMVKTLLRLGKAFSFGGKSPASGMLKSITDIFGGRLKVIISGGAAIKPEILQFFNDLGIIAVQGYGLTECSPMAALNPGKRSLIRNESVGRILPQFEVKIADADEAGVGEICIKGPNVMLGYYKNEAETTASIVDGWFHTGDLGYVDDDDYIYITGRKKSVIIAPNGKNVYPEELEFLLSESRLIEEAFVWPVDDDNGQNKIIAATIKPDMDEVADNSTAISELIQQEVDSINDSLPAFKKISRVIIRTREFEKTTAQKLKRFSEDNRLN